MPVLRPALQQLWLWFLDLGAGRPVSEAGPRPIPYAEIDAWCRLNTVALAPWQLRALRLLDFTYLKAVAAYRSKP